MSFRLIEAERAQHRVSRLCQVLGVTRAGYYAWKSRPPSRRALADRELRSLIACVFADSRETYGAPRIQAELADEHGLRVSQKRVARLMRELGIVGVSRRRKGLRTTVRCARRPRRPISPAATSAPRGPTASGSRTSPTSPPGRAMSSSPACSTPGAARWSAGRCATTCERSSPSTRSGWRSRDDGRAPGLVHHSDRGSQYTSLAFGKTIEAAGVLPSMGRRGDAFDNALAESFFATLETELLDQHSFRSRDEARLALFSYIEGFYNPRRRHSTLG